MDIKLLKKKIEEVLNNLNVVQISNKTKANVIAEKIIEQLEAESIYTGPYLIKNRSEREN